MAVSNFEKNYANKMLDRLEQEMRAKVEKQRGQLLIIPGPKELKDAVEDTFDGHVEISDFHYASAIREAREHAARLQESFKKRHSVRFAAVENVIIDNRMGLPPSFVLGENMFLVTSFRYSINAVKGTMLKYFVRKKLLTDSQKKELSRNVHKGHGVRGSAVSQVEIASALSAIPSEYEDDVKKAFVSFAKQAKLPANIRVEVLKQFVEHKRTVTPDGNLKDDYVSSVAFQLGKTNIGKDATFEKSVKKAFRDFAKEYSQNLFNESGSATLKQQVTKVLLDKFDSEKFLKVDSKDKKVSLKTKHKTTTKGRKQKVGKAEVRSGGPKTRKVQFATNSASAPLAMLQAFNMRLPDKIAANMQSPALNYRSGRFAESVKVTDAMITPGGFLSFGYTYQKNPYQTFEPGFEQGSTERDPRKLIDRTMREIAAEFAIGRFYTRRL